MVDSLSTAPTPRLDAAALNLAILPSAGSAGTAAGAAGGADSIDDVIYFITTIVMLLLIN
jgi:hypothetical protein